MMKEQMTQQNTRFEQQQLFQQELLRLNEKMRRKMQFDHFDLQDHVTPPQEEAMGAHAKSCRIRWMLCIEIFGHCTEMYKTWIGYFVLTALYPYKWQLSQSLADLYERMHKFVEADEIKIAARSIFHKDDKQFKGR
ncbi:hypothetical protein PVK06_010472 [Gossypium arboreum]|uniref:Uncharacterized protein n=1 Tax=Gossypium arboreum TaxID=29729 RepID=A0ABR0Q6F0_GOSAR|nr:hypothetical protein PVK06_010472 [Gossypium arboreum]